MGLTGFLHRIATGPRHSRTMLTPVGLLLFGISLLLVVGAGLAADKAFQLSPVFPEPIGPIAGLVLSASGLLLCGWCVVRFRRAAGTPVPMNPPEELVVEGPYRLTRNPMLTGVFAGLFGLGALLHSTGMVCISIPAYIVLHLIELRLVEEPELERRFGAAYRHYRRQVPMFFPRLCRRAGLHRG